MGFGSVSRPDGYSAVLAVLALGVGALMAVTPSTAAPSAPSAESVQAQSRPSAGTALESELEGVSCTLASACTAVGDEETSTGASVALAERWNGTSWAAQSTPTPSGAQASYFDGVSCTSASSCTAVGHYVTSAENSAPMAEVWNGSAWTVQSVPAPGGVLYSDLEKVSCTSASACTAVGYSETDADTYEALSEIWNGTAWTIESVPTPSGATSSALLGVSCASASSCTATGYSSTSASELTLAEVWNGATWAIESTPNPSGAVSSELSGVSCASASSCTATGYSEASSGSITTLAEVWNGSAWAVQSTPNPSGALDSFLGGVSCASASSCTAVGWYETSPGAYDTLAESWNGSVWAVQSTPDPSGASASYLFSASCASAAACTAVGYSIATTYTALAEGWNGTVWAVHTA